MNEPLVTALMPVKHYHAGYLSEALGSLFDQTSPTWRLVVVGEADTLPELERQLAPALQDDRVTLVPNAGRKLSGAFNTGMRQARTELVAILLGDDRWSPLAIETVHMYVEHFPCADFFHSSRIIIDERGHPISSVHRNPDVVRVEDFLVGAPVKHLLCWRREMGLAIGGMDETLNSVGPDDFDFPWSMAEAGARFQNIAEPLYFYRDHRESYRLTTHLPMSVHEREIARIMKKHGASSAQVRARLRSARHSFLRQCLYRSAVHRWIKERMGHDPRQSWRESYR